MAFRRPLKLNGSNLQEMANTDIENIQNLAFWQYISNPSVSLSVVGSSGNLGTINDTRLQAGTYSTRVERFPTEEETEEPTTVTVGYARLDQTVTDTNPPSDNGTSFPVYYDSTGNIRSMNLQDMYDTFGYAAIENLQTASSVETIYRIHTSTSFTGYSLVSATPIFSDTSADVSAYTADEIPESLDQPQVNSSYYLLKRDYVAPEFPLPVKNDSNNLASFDSSSFQSIIETMIRHLAAEVSGYRLRYSWDGTGTTVGSVIDQRLNGSGNYTQRFVDANDYRAQEFPNGSLVTVNTYNLRLRQE